MKPINAVVVGMTHNPDHATSVAAAESVSGRRITLRKMVEDYAKTKPHGFIDEDLVRLLPDSPESSLRKRRTELADDNTIVASEETRLNSAGQDCIVWYHRDHVTNPPPHRPGWKKPSKATHQAQRIAALESALRRAIKVANEAREEWDAAPSGMKAGKLLIALSGHLPRYRADIDAIHETLNA